MCEKTLTVKRLNQPHAGDRIRRELLPAVRAKLKPQCQQVVGAFIRTKWAEPAGREWGSVEEEAPKRFALLETAETDLLDVPANVHKSQACE